MKIDCINCGEPVHANVLKCPHCGKPSGATPSKPTAAEIAAIAQVEEARFYNTLELAGRPSSFAAAVSRYDGPHLVDAVARLSELVEEPWSPGLDALPPPDPTATRTRPPTEPATLPTAVARMRPPTVEPIPSKAPEPAPPPADQPRFLK